MNNLEHTVGKNIKRLRKKQRLTQRALADRIFVSFQAVSRLEENDWSIRKAVAK